MRAKKPGGEERLYQIGEVAEITGLTGRTLRYYEELGLLGEREHAAGKHRVYTKSEIERIGRIKRFKELLGHQLSEIKDILDLDEERRRLSEEIKSGVHPAKIRVKLQREREIFEEELSAVRDKLARLKEVEKQIRVRIADVDQSIENLDRKDDESDR